MSDMTINTTPLPRGGVRIHVAHDGSDSLAVIEVKYHYSTLSVRAGLRGNFDAHRRPMRWMASSIEAPLVTAEARYRRAVDYVSRRRCWGDPGVQGLLSRLADAVGRQP